MKYLGGKHFESRWIAEYLESVRAGRPYVEPFVGAGSVLVRMEGRRYASDIHPDLILMWKALQAGWEPPDVVSREVYMALRNDPTPSATRGFVGFGCSYFGKWFGSYDKGKWGNAAARAKGTLLKVVEKIQGVRFTCRDFRKVRPRGSLVYCDPPYEDLAKFAIMDSAFDAASFWEWVRTLAKSNRVVVSSFKAPRDFRCVSKMKTETLISRAANWNNEKGRGNSINVVEKLFEWRDGHV